MIVGKRRMKRNWCIILTAVGFALLVLFRYYMESLSYKVNQMSRSDAEYDEVIDKQRKEMQKPAAEVIGMQVGRDDKGIIITKQQAKLKNSLERGENCKLDPRENLFTENEDGYDMIRLSKDEIYSEKFTHSISQAKPVFLSSVFRLNPDRFLLPILMRGPNNQLVGFRESVYVAMKLNRTIVIPYFTRHRTDSQLEEGTAVHPAHRVDFQELCKFVSCITLQQFRKACGNQADVIFRLRHYSRNRIGVMESRTGMRFSESADGENVVLNLLPSVKGKTVTTFSPDKKDIDKLFASTKRCGIYAQPFYNMKIKPKPSKNLFRLGTDLNAYTNNEIFSEIIRRTPAPSYIHDITDEFVKATFGGAKFITVHWRYDKTDWMKRCKTLAEESDRKHRCNEALLMEPKNLADAILTKIKDMKPEISGITHIYIASPPNELNFIKAANRILNTEKYAVFGLEDLIKFLKEKHASCKFLWEYEDDIVSTIEMQICAKGIVFLKSSRSSWSSNVINWRRHNSMPGIQLEKDEDVFQLTKIARNGYD